MHGLGKIPLALTVFLLGLGPDRASPTQPAETEQLKLPSANVPDEWLTLAERTAFVQTPRYDETVAYCRRLAAASPWLDYRSFGRSPEGRELPLMIASKDGAFTPEAARSAGRLVVLAQCCIHAGECAGKDACLMLLRDAAITKTQSELLNNVVLVVMPIFNVDGHERFGPYSRVNQNGPAEMGWRVTSRNLNLNRDYIKADAVEMRAWLAVWNAWRPDFHFDHHTTDGGDWQYDLLFATDRHQCAAPEVAKWLDQTLHPQLIPALEADGHIPMTYFSLLDSRDPAKGIRSGGFGPRYSTGYVSLRNRPSILVESHALKSYRTRVIGHYNIMRRVLEILNRDPQSLREAVRAADQATVAMGSTYDPDFRLPVAITSSDEPEPLTFRGFAYRRELSEVSGDVRIIYDNTRPVKIETTWTHGTKVVGVVNPPLAYIIPPQWTEVIELARAHGLRCRRLAEPLTMDFETYCLENVSFGQMPYDGRFEPRYETRPVVERRTYLPGSVVIPLDQADAKVAIHLFEPAAPDSLASWGFFNAIFERKEYAADYVLEELARRMLQADPGLGEEFEARIRTDREFAGDPRARLHFFYKRSPYWDQAIGRYPIARIIKPLSAETILID